MVLSTIVVHFIANICAPAHFYNYPNMWYCIKACRYSWVAWIKNVSSLWLWLDFVVWLLVPDGMTWIWWYRSKENGQAGSNWWEGCSNNHFFSYKVSNKASHPTSWTWRPVNQEPETVAKHHRLTNTGHLIIKIKCYMYNIVILIICNIFFNTQPFSCHEPVNLRFHHFSSRF